MLIIGKRGYGSELLTISAVFRDTRVKQVKSTIGHNYTLAYIRTYIGFIVLGNEPHVSRRKLVFAILQDVVSVDLVTVRHSFKGLNIKSL